MDGPKSQPVLLSDVALKAGVSVGAASMALREQRNIARKTRDHVRAIAEEMGYRPNLAASMLARQRPEVSLSGVPIALVGMSEKNQNNLPAQIFVQHFITHAVQRGFLVDEPDPTTSTSLTKLLQIFYHRGIRGIILSRCTDISDLTEKDVEPFSIIYHGGPIGESRFHQVRTEVFESTRFLWETMWSRGYRRIGAALFRHHLDIQDDFAREAAVVNCQSHYSADRIPIFTGARKDLASWARELKLDAILAFHGSQHYSLLEEGIRIPEDIGFAALHTSFDGKITGLYEDFNELGRVTVSQLDSMIRHNETGFPLRPHAVSVSPVFREGISLPPRTVSSKPSRSKKRSLKA